MSFRSELSLYVWICNWHRRLFSVGARHSGPLRSGPMSLRAAQKQMTYELFLTTALDLFGSKGYAATTIDDIATAAGSTRTTFYLHFSSKSEVISALLTKADAILTAPDDPPLTEVVASGSRPDIRPISIASSPSGTRSSPISRRRIRPPTNRMSLREPNSGSRMRSVR